MRHILAAEVHTSGSFPAQKTVATNFKVDLEEFHHLMRLELRREETRKAALHALIDEIVVYPDAMIEVKYRIRNRYRTASKAVEDGQYPRVCTATAYIHYVG